MHRLIPSPRPSDTDSPIELHLKCVCSQRVVSAVGHRRNGDGHDEEYLIVQLELVSPIFHNAAASSWAIRIPQCLFIGTNGTRVQRKMNL